MADPQGTYIAKSDGFWWSGNYQSGVSWNGSQPNLGDTTVSVTSITSSTVVLHWTAVGGATGYLVGRDGSDAQGHGPWSQTDTPDTYSQTFTSLLASTSYTLYCEPQPGGTRKTIQVTTAAASAPGQLPVADVGTTVGSASYAVPSGAVFVATNGSDTNSGTQASPFATMAKAASTAPSGGTIVVRAGIYYQGGTTQGGAATNGIDLNRSVTIQNYPGETVWFDGSRSATSWTSSSGLWTTSYDRLFDRSPTNSRGAADGSGASQWVNASYPCAPWPDMVFMDGVQLTQVVNKTDLAPGKFWVQGTATGSGYWFQGSAIWIADDPSGHTMEVSDKVKLFFTHQPSTNIKGIGIRRYANSNPDGGVLNILRNDSLVENVWIEDVSNDGVHFAGDTSRDTSNCIMRNCTSRRTGNLAATAYESDGTLFDKVDVQYANYSHWNYAPQAGGIKVSRSQTIIVQNSLFQHINGKGFWTDMTVDNAQVYNSVFNDTDDKAIKFECGTNKLTLANCLFTNINGAGFQVNNCDRADVWNCTIVNAGDYGAQWPQDTRRPSNMTYNKDPRQPDSYYTLSYNQWQINQLAMHNCVITSASEPYFSLQLGDRGLPDTRGLSDFTITMDGNVYNNTGSAPSNAFLLPNSSNGSTNYQTLSSFQSVTGQDANSTQVTGSSVVDGSYQLTNATYHTNATALPANIASAIGQSAGTKHAGAFL